MTLAAIVRTMILQLVGALAMGGLLLFLPAGTLAWPQAWVFIGLFYGCSQAMGLWLLRKDPDLLAARTRSPFSGAQTRRDRAIVVAILIGFCAWLVVMALDARRFAWSHTPLWAQALGAVLIVGAFWGWIGVLAANSFAASTIELQAERGQRVISTGPYAWVRHPMYAYTILLMLGMPLLLGSLWGLLGLVALLPLLGARAIGEEALLRGGLPGYADYSRKVRFRLVPGVW
jgi:protein-S-isoprenylcysteine O-methyltransferase Ste14